MRSAFSRVLTATVAAVAINSAALAAAPAAKGPRLPDGKPDLNGVWQALNSANYDLEPHAARAALALVPGQFVPVPAPQVVALGAVGAVPGGLGIVEGGTIPYKPEALTQKQQNQKDWLTSDPEIKCYLPGVPRATYMPYPFQIVQSKDHVFFAYEYAGAVRNIYMKDPGPAPADSWMGQSTGKWDGDTFVIEATGFNGSAWLDRSGNYTTDKHKVTERYTLRDADHIWYEATIENPDLYTRPWKISMPLYRRVEPDAQLGQFKCVEFVEELMYGEYRKKPTAAADKPKTE